MKKKCMQCGGKVKMAKGGSTMKTKVGSATPKGQIYGIPQTGPTGPNYQGIDTMKKGGSTKAKFGASVPVKDSCKKGQVRSADGKCVMERPKFAKGGSTSFGMLSVKAGIDKNPGKTFADKIAGAKMQKGGVTTTVTKPKSTDPYSTAVKGHQMKMEGLALKAKGQLMKASGAAMKAKGAAMKQAGSTQKKAKGGVVSRKK